MFAVTSWLPVAPWAVGLRSRPSVRRSTDCAQRPVETRVSLWESGDLSSLPLAGSRCRQTMTTGPTNVSLGGCSQFPESKPGDDHGRAKEAR
jgi:hypothetical protein